MQMRLGISFSGVDSTGVYECLLLSSYFLFFNSSFTLTATFSKRESTENCSNPDQPSLFANLREQAQEDQLNDINNQVLIDERIGEHI
jgi:hypothetical protein